MHGPKYQDSWQQIFTRIRMDPKAKEIKRCVRTCSFDKTQGKCVSCDRTIDEIKQAYVDYKRSLEEKYLDTTIPVEK